MERSGEGKASLLLATLAVRDSQANCDACRECGQRDDAIINLAVQADTAGGDEASASLVLYFRPVCGVYH